MEEAAPPRLAPFLGLVALASPPAGCEAPHRSGLPGFFARDAGPAGGDAGATFCAAARPSVCVLIQSDAKGSLLQLSGLGRARIYSDAKRKGELLKCGEIARLPVLGLLFDYAGVRATYRNLSVGCFAHDATHHGLVTSLPLLSASSLVFGGLRMEAL